MQEVKKIAVIGPESTGKSTICKQLATHYQTLWCPEYAREYLSENGTSYTYEDLLEIAKGQLRLEDEYTEELRNPKSEIRNPKSEVRNEESLEAGGGNQESGIGSRQPASGSRESGVDGSASRGNEEILNLKTETLNLQSQTTNHKLQITNFKPLFMDTNMYVIKVWCEFVFNKCHQLILDEIVKRPYDFYLLMNTDLPWSRDALREYPDLESREKLYHIYKDILVNQEVPWINISGTNEERLQSAIDGIDQFYIS